MNSTELAGAWGVFSRHNPVVLQGGEISFVKAEAELDYRTSSVKNIGFESLLLLSHSIAF